nr:MAG TPA: Replication associated protein [Microviridae sp.]
MELKNIHFSPVRCTHPHIILNPYFEELYRTCKFIYLDGRFDKTEDFVYDVPSSRYSAVRQGATLLNYKNFYFVDNNGECIPLYIIVPCGKCWLCRHKKANEWSFRAICESMYSTTTPLFVTLTYADEYLPSGGLDKKDVQLFLKRLRKRLEAYNSQYQGIRYFAVGEYGSKFGRPHYHLIIWNFPETNLVTIREYIDLAWGNGFVYIEPVTKGGINYVMKYVRKSRKIPAEYTNPTFYLSSRGNGGLGIQYCNEIKDWCRENPEFQTLTVVDPFTGASMSLALPTYFKDKIFPTKAKLVPIEVRKAFKACNYFACYIQSVVGTEKRLDMSSDYYKEFEPLLQQYDYILAKYSFLPFADYLTPRVDLYAQYKKAIKSKTPVYEVRRALKHLESNLGILLKYELDRESILKSLKVLERRKEYLSLCPEEVYDVLYQEELVKKRLEDSIINEVF